MCKWTEQKFFEGSSKNGQKTKKQTNKNTMKKCLPSLAMKKIQVKTTLKC
jgi:hypothetical protein